jgi:hypothetical protein
MLSGLSSPWLIPEWLDKDIELVFPGGPTGLVRRAVFFPPLHANSTPTVREEGTIREYHRSQIGQNDPCAP